MRRRQNCWRLVSPGRAVCVIAGRRSPGARQCATVFHIPTRALLGRASTQRLCPVRVLWQALNSTTIPLCALLARGIRSGGKVSAGAFLHFLVLCLRGPLACPQVCGRRLSTRVWGLIPRTTITSQCTYAVHCFCLFSRPLRNARVPFKETATLGPFLDFGLRGAGRASQPAKRNTLNSKLLAPAVGLSRRLASENMEALGSKP